MPRRRPFSAKQKKEQMQAKRARKRGDDASAPSAPARRRAPARSAPAPARLALESRFVALPPGFLDRTRDLAYAERLPRPLPAGAAAFPLHLLTAPCGLGVPARPRFRYGQSKREVERNEEGVFRKWLAGTRGEVTEWMEASLDEEEGWPRSPSWFETNLEVWRQLWRVVEASSILLLLVDARAPPLHCPPSLRKYLRSLKPRRQFVLVLTKADLVDPAALEGWRAWLKTWWSEGGEESGAEREGGKGGEEGKDGKEGKDGHGPADEQDDTQVVAVTSYDLELMYAGAGSKRRHRPAIPSASRLALVDALRRAHERLLTPPEWGRDPSKGWRAGVRSNVDWDALAAEPDEPAKKGKPRRADRGDGGAEGEASEGEEGEASEEESEEEAETTPPTRDPEAEPLTVGLIGQPNVGKSSLLNALLGTTKVRASKTPGKTKHFQTILWGAAREVKIVDCPGLVCPSPVPMELQAMAGILPISQIPSLPACTAFVARHMPLEEVFRVPPPERFVDDIDARKTWRGERPAAAAKDDGVVWTAGEIMEARALDRGFLTAKGGRPDANRAANGMLRTVADGRVRWGFWPPGTDLEARRGVGVWLGGNPDLEALGAESDESESEEEPATKEGDASSEGSESDDESGESDGDSEEEEESSFAAQNTRSFFDALSLEAGSGDESGGSS